MLKDVELLYSPTITRIIWFIIYPYRTIPDQEGKDTWKLKMRGLASCLGRQLQKHDQEMEQLRNQPLEQAQKKRSTSSISTQPQIQAPPSISSQQEFPGDLFIWVIAMFLFWFVLDLHYCFAVEIVWMFCWSTMCCFEVKFAPWS